MRTQPTFELRRYLRFQNFCGRLAHSVEDICENRCIADFQVVGEVRPENCANEVWAPWFLDSDTSDPTRQDAVPRKRFRTAPGQRILGTEPLDVAPHVLTTDAKPIERRTTDP